MAWSMTLSGRLTQPVVVDDTVYVAETDTHTVHALSIAEGTRKWSLTGDGRIDSTPSTREWCFWVPWMAACTACAPWC
ncbi:MAG: PQQ-binding-like beta-propeller repeat protein [Gammaproteobacteria bacterium]|nr:PQQ-binding-like beta-propeller repeat protein [Gammaproteobacteria bacterium]